MISEGFSFLLKRDIIEKKSVGCVVFSVEKAPTLCIWDCKAWGAQPTGHQSFVFQTANLDATMEGLKKKGVSLSEAIQYDWGTYEVRLSDIDENEIVIAEFTKERTL